MMSFIIPATNSWLHQDGTTGVEKLPSNNRTRLISCDKKNFPPCFSSRVNKLFQHEEDWSCEWRILNYPWNIIYLELSFSFMPKRAVEEWKLFRFVVKNTYVCFYVNCGIVESEDEEKFSFILRSTLHFAWNRFVVVDNTWVLQENFWQSCSLPLKT